MPVPTYLPWHSPIAYDPRPCVADERRELTYAELADEVEAAAEQLAEHGVGRGSVVALALPNQVELLVAMIAAWRLGAVAAPVDPTLTRDEIARHVVASGAVLAIAVADNASGTGRPVITADRLRRARLGTPLPVPMTDLDESALVIRTGAAGRPRYVVLTHGNLAAMTKSLVSHLRITLDDHCLLVLPLVHGSAIGASFLAPLSVGGRLSMLRDDAPALLLDAVARLRPTYFSGTAATYESVLATLEGPTADASSLRLALCCDASAAADTLDSAEKALGCPVVAGYGPVEGAFAIAANPLNDRRAGTAGVALPGQQVAIMGADGGFLPPGEFGEVVVRGRTVMQGYLDDPEATALAIGDGWLHTGDVGALDTDGFLRVARLDEAVSRAGCAGRYSSTGPSQTRTTAGRARVRDLRAGRGPHCSP